MNSAIKALKVYGEPGTLYARCGGAFGISSFVDRCMDLWMADETVRHRPARLGY